ncbi:MAG: YjjW family glycine radical enzyme activase [Proteobacteria bacterium]|nr:YjjW family glycine radical enzyme activase [Pseudomonadota bacterium]
MKARINKIIPFSSVDGTGNRTAIFLQGCNFKCAYCHNPETIQICDSCGNCVLTCPTESLFQIDSKVGWVPASCIQCDQCIQECPNFSSPKVREMTVNEVMREIEGLFNFIRGVTVSGGECMLQTEFLLHFFKKIKQRNLTTYIDSNGSVPFSSYPGLMEMTDGVMLDLKAFFDDDHQHITGQTNQVVLENIHFLTSQKKLLEVRVVVLPEYLDNQKNISHTARFLSTIDPELPLKLIAFRPFGVKESEFNQSIPSDLLMSDLKSVAETEGLGNVVVI